MKTWPNVKVVVSFITILSFTPLQISANNFYTKSELIKSVKDNTAEYNSGLYKFVTGFIFSNAAFALDRPPASNLRPTNPGQNPDVIKNIGTALDDEVDTQLQKYIADDRVVELVKEGDKYVAYRVKKVKNYADIPYEKRKAGPVKKLGVFNQERGKKLYEITDQAIVQRLDKIGRRIAYVEGVDRILEGKKSLVHTGTRDWYGEYLLTNLLLSPNTDLLERIAKHEQKHEIPGYRHEDDPEYLQLLDEVELFAAGTNHLKQQRMQYTGNKIQAETERDAILNRIRYFRERVVSTEPISQEAIDADSQELVELLKYPDKDLESPAFWAAHALDGLFQSPRQINQEIIDKRSQELVELLKHDSYGNRAALALGYLFRSPRQINQEIIDKRSQELVGLLKHPNSNVIWWTTHALRDLFQRPRQKIPQEIINAYAKELVELLKKYGGNSGAMDCLKELFLSDKEVPQEIIDDASK